LSALARRGQPGRNLAEMQRRARLPPYRGTGDLVARSGRLRPEKTPLWWPYGLGGARQTGPPFDSPPAQDDADRAQGTIGKRKPAKTIPSV